MPPKARLKADHLRQFLFELAERLGKTVKQLERELDSDELLEWMALEELRRDRPKRKRWTRGSTSPQLV